MNPHNQPADEQNRSVDPAQPGADQGPGTTSEQDPRDVSPIMDDAHDYRDEVIRRDHQDSPAAEQGADFDQQRRQGTGGIDDNSGPAGRNQGMGQAGFNGDLDRGYDQSGPRGGLGSSGGGEDVSKRNISADQSADQNASTGGYGAGNYGRPDEVLGRHIGMYSRNPTDDEAASLQSENHDPS